MLQKRLKEAIHMTLSWSNQGGIAAPTRTRTAAPEAADEYMEVLEAAKGTFWTLAQSAGMGEDMAKAVWNGFRLEGIEGPFEYNGNEFPNAAKLVHIGGDSPNAFLPVVERNDAFAEFAFGMVCFSLEQALMKTHINGFTYSVFVERSNTNWSACSKDVQIYDPQLKAKAIELELTDRKAVQKNTYNVFRAFITPKVGTRGMSPAVLFSSRQKAESPTPTPAPAAPTSPTGGVSWTVPAASNTSNKADIPF